MVLLYANLFKFSRDDSYCHGDVLLALGASRRGADDKGKPQACPYSQESLVTSCLSLSRGFGCGPSTHQHLDLATIVLFTIARISLQGPSPLTFSTVVTLIREAILCGSLILAISAASDRWYFGFWTFPAYNFLYFNLSKSLAVFYGRSPWHYYFLQGLPLICTTSLPFAVAALYKPTAHATSTQQSNVLKTLAYTVFTTVGALSLITHKEVRFIYPLLPALSILAAPCTASFFTSKPSPTTNNPRPQPQIRNKRYLFVALGVNLFLAGYLSFFHQPAPLNVLTYLRHEYERIHPDSVQLAQTSHFSATPKNEDELFALFLMPCHSTPWRSHLIYPGLRAYALGCEPPLHTEPNTPERDNYRDEADRFYDDPIPFLASELFSPTKAVTVPRYIVGFEGIEPWLQEFVQTSEAQSLGLTQVRPVWKGFNGLFNEDWRRSGDMIVWDTGVYDNAPPQRNYKRIFFVLKNREAEVCTSFQCTITKAAVVTYRTPTNQTYRLPWHMFGLHIILIVTCTP
ncbi:hypothetical protein NXS19_009218 [Fusarium pseudograminearum]|nr:hypothetical protein NXS19_009218 [Fusarium pseudograminearum]